MINSEKLSVGVDNLLINCANLKVGDDLLIIRERESLGWYKNDISEGVAAAAIKKGIKTSILDVGKPDNSEKKSLNSVRKMTKLTDECKILQKLKFQKK